MNRITIFLILTALIIGGCVSASSQTGASTESAAKVTQTEQQKSNQANQSNDNVVLTVPPTIIDIKDSNGITTTHIVIGGARAETKSQNSQTADIQAIQKAVSEATSKSASESYSNAKASIMPLVILAGIALLLLVIFSVGSRLLPVVSAGAAAVRAIKERLKK